MLTNFQSPNESTAPSGNSVRALFVSDIHLGSKHTQAEDFLELLRQYEPRYLYIVGDFIDGWKLKRRWRWSPVYDQIFQRMMKLKQSGTELLYTPGNHDHFLRNYLTSFGVITIRDRFVHEAADGRKYVVTHGDQFDRVEQNWQWLSLVGSYAYDAVLTTNRWANRLRGKKHDPYALSGLIKRRVKKLVKRLSDYEEQLAQNAREADCQGIICGHSHTPRIEAIDGIAYLNTGDWVENCTALLEYDDGHFELIHRDGTLIDHLPARPEVQES